MHFRWSNIAIFGGSGSIGTAIAKEMVKTDLRQINLITNDENSLWESQQYFKKEPRIEGILADIRDAETMEAILMDTDYVFNCAAIKHVPIAENFPMEAIKTNLIGLENILRACKKNHIKKLLHISTDKAVEPSSVMGATKLLCERMCLANKWKIPASIIRFGNVYGSRGSLVPIIERKLENNENVPITDKKMKRYFITLKKAAGIAVKCMEMMEGGEIFVPQMEEEFIVNIVDKIIAESGVPPSQVEIEYIGARAGEKLEEKLMTEDEKSRRKLIESIGVYMIK